MLTDDQRNQALREALEAKIESMNIQLTPDEKAAALASKQEEIDAWEANIAEQRQAATNAGPAHPQGTEKLSDC